MDSRNLRKCPKCQEYASAKRTYIRVKNEKGKYQYEPIGYFFVNHACTYQKGDEESFVEVENKNWSFLKD